MTTEEGGQLELFELRHGPAPRPHRESLGRFLISLRYDQLLLSGVGGLLLLTVVFAGGVERGKQLVRGERALFTRPPEASPSAVPQASKAEVRSKSTGSEEPKSSAPAAKPKAPVKSASGAARPSKVSRTQKGNASRYAIQVVTYTRPQLAKKELDRLRAKGERAFLVMRGGHTTLYIGPFPSRDNASDKLMMLKPKYQDCILRVL